MKQNFSITFLMLFLMKVSNYPMSGILSNHSPSASFHVSVVGQSVALNTEEPEELLFHCEHAGRDINHENLPNHLWMNEIYFVDLTIDLLANKLSEKLGTHGDYIKLGGGIGYRLKESLIPFIY